MLVVRKGKLGAPGDGAKRSWLRGEEKNMARRGRLLALKEMGLGLGFFFVFSLMFQNCPPLPLFVCVVTSIYRQNGLVLKTHRSFNFFIFCQF